MMKKSILNIGTVLSRVQQKSINGGTFNTCKFTITRDNGLTYIYRAEVPGLAGADISAEANNICVNAIYDPNDTVAGCSYDCMHDGPG